MTDWQRSYSTKHCNNCLPPGWTSAIIGINRIQCANLIYQYIDSNWMSKLETDPTLHIVFAKWITPITKSSASVAVTTIWLPQWNKTRSTYSFFQKITIQLGQISFLVLQSRFEDKRNPKLPPWSANCRHFPLIYSLTPSDQSYFQSIDPNRGP